MIHLPLPKPAPGFWPTLAILALALVYLAAFVMTADGQAKQAGVGLPGVPRPDFHFSWCEQKRPPGRQATCTAKAPADFDCRICPSNGWSGYYAEFYQRTTAAMRGAWAANYWGTMTTHDGAVVQSAEPTSGVLAAEFSWVEVTYPRTHEIYRRFWYEGVEGGTAASPIVINPDTLRFNLDRIDCVKALGSWPAAGATGSYIGFDPVAPVDVCTNRFPPPGARPLWPVWVRNDLPADHPVNAGTAPPPPPVPVPVPPSPEPPPPTPPPCTSWQISGWLEQCQRLATKAGKELSGAGLCVWCERKQPAATTTLAKLRGLVCEPVCEATPPPPPFNPTCEECLAISYVNPACGKCPCPDGASPSEPPYCVPPPPPPPVCPPTAFELHCRALGGSDSLCLALARYVGACDPECDPKCYIPGIPSTGRLENVLVPGAKP